MRAPGGLQRNPLTGRAMSVWLRLRLNEVGPLVALLGVSILGYGFFYLAHEVGEGSTAALDRKILLALRNPADLSDPIGPPWLEETMRDITGLGSVFTVLFLTCAVAAYLAVSGRRRISLFVLAAVGSGELISTVLKLFYQRPRPDLVPHGMEVFTASFPSGHATMSAIAYLTLATLIARLDRNRSAKALVLGLGVGLTLLVGLSRIYLGVHWPSDVLAGWCIGAAWASLCWFVALQLQRRGEVEAPDPPPPA
ncbi:MULTISPECIES: phosphatase PAP2 family protein [unclassified Methylobacterium]|uniref:phosphatase PAP2 family protein n=1 Tax=unclassified Methylobacterium TaxID=2615210 RepID=UPI0011C1D482|nr:MULTISPECIES: phosphatase PAP2 family protein [unclassified Methylobacterium]QEE38216.1 phosphatase PAP2 family protein [Methylobacterium sp. WL1]TXN04646.1 phosphatase PAP2 family protein [Methylobacterium sp. WL64]TXN55886.1 phosphatase PAP2 family protein [Methylobacterium sp. WL2]